MSDRQCSSCGGFCGRGGCKRENVKPEQKPELEFWPGDVLICKEDDSKVTVVHGNRGPMQLMNGKIAIAWSDAVGGEYTIEQIKEMFYQDEKPEQDAQPARKPLSDERIDQIIASNVTITDRNLYGAVYMAIREVEQEHGIGSD